MTCQPNAPSLDICPTQAQILPHLLSLLPRGRAWNTHEGPPQQGTTIWNFWNAVANVLAWINQRICALRLEFFCATADETLDLWMAEYGLPDGCDPYPNLCAKVAALGGNQCSYYAAVAAQAGWSITCSRYGSGCGAQMGSSQMGCSTTGGGVLNAALLIIVSLSKSPAYSGGFQTQPLMGVLQAGMPLACPPNIAGIQCLLARICRAHVELFYEVTP